MSKKLARLLTAFLLSVTLVSCAAAGKTATTIIKTPINLLKGMVGAAKRTISQNELPSSSSSSSAVADRGTRIEQRGEFGATTPQPATMTASR